MQVRYPFTKYIFVDKNPKCIAALKARIYALDGGQDVSFIEKDVSAAVPAIIGETFANTWRTQMTIASRGSLVMTTGGPTGLPGDIGAAT